MIKIKFFILSLILISSAAANRVTDDGIGGSGGGPKQSWQDIMENPKMQPAFPPVILEGQMVRYNFLCLHDGVVRTQYKVKIVNRETEETFFKYLYEDKSDHDVINGQCYMEEIPRQLPIYVYARQANDSNDLNEPREVLFIKSYKLPVCRADD